MAKLEGNTFGGFRGKLGNVVGYSWKGVWCVRTLPARVRNPRSEAQQRHRALFAEEVRLAGRMGWALNLGLAAVADELHMTPQNVFVKANQGAFGPAAAAGGVQTAADSVPGNSIAGLAVDWSALIVSAGPVAPVAVGTPAVDDGGVLTVAFEKNPLHLRADKFDQVHLYVYCPALNAGYLAAPVYRKEQTVSLVLPDGMAGQECHLYAFVTDKEGRASETAYAPCCAQSAMQDQSDLSDLSDTSDLSDLSDLSDTSDKSDLSDLSDESVAENIEVVALVEEKNRGTG